MLYTLSGSLYNTYVYICYICKYYASLLIKYSTKFQLESRRLCSFACHNRLQHVASGLFIYLFFFFLFNSSKDDAFCGLHTLNNTAQQVLQHKEYSSLKLKQKLQYFSCCNKENYTLLILSFNSLYTVAIVITCGTVLLDMPIPYKFHKY